MLLKLVLYSRDGRLYFNRRERAGYLYFNRLKAYNDADRRVDYFFKGEATNFTTVPCSRHLDFATKRYFRYSNRSRHFPYRLVTLKLPLPLRIRANVNRAIRRVNDTVLNGRFDRTLNRRTTGAVGLTSLLLNYFPSNLREAGVLYRRYNNFVTSITSSGHGRRLVRVILLKDFSHLRGVIYTLFLRLFRYRRLLCYRVVRVYHEICRPFVRRLHNSRNTRAISIRYVPKYRISSVTRYLYETFQISATRDDFVFRIRY